MKTCKFYQFFSVTFFILSNKILYSFNINKEKKIILYIWSFDICISHIFSFDFYIFALFTISIFIFDLFLVFFRHFTCLFIWRSISNKSRKKNVVFVHVVKNVLMDIQFHMNKINIKVKVFIQFDLITNKFKQMVLSKLVLYLGQSKSSCGGMIILQRRLR
jgi:hypothetical protein